VSVRYPLQRCLRRRYRVVALARRLPPPCVERPDGPRDSSMSEYQYYEFRAIDRPLDGKQMDELRALSTRAEITPTSFTNTYHWGDFKGKPAVLMDRYFDAFVYVANWGTHRLMFRIPLGFLDVDAIEAYCDGEVVSLTRGKEHVVIDFTSQDESGDEWTEGEPWMPSLVSI